jgi:hypothetical protein
MRLMAFHPPWTIAREPCSPFRAKKLWAGCRSRRSSFVVRARRPVRPSWIKGDKPMRVMVLVKATKDSEAGIMPSTELLEAMGKFN